MLRKGLSSVAVVARRGFAASFTPYPLEREGLDKICKWSPDKAEREAQHCPHKFREIGSSVPKICSSILDAIGHTPLVRLDRLPELEAWKDTEFLAKCEFMNPGGSSKDRIGLAMIEAAERDGRLKPGGLVIEPTSGNTGIGLALACAVKGYKLVAVLKESIGEEKLRILRGLGADVVRCRADVKSVHPESYLNISLKIHEENPGSLLTDQYSNPYNGLGHYETAAKEMIDQCDGKIDYMVIGAGTCGTLTGIARRLKEEIPNVQVVAADCEGSILYRPDPNEKRGGFTVEGIGRDFIPRQLDYRCVDHWVKIADKPGFQLARSLLRYEGLFCGSSSGSAVLGAIEFMRRMPAEEMKGKRVLIHLPDTIRNYLSAHVSTEWMLQHGWLNEDDLPPASTEKVFHKLEKFGEAATVGSYFKSKAVDSPLVLGLSTAAEAIEAMRNLGTSAVLVANEKGGVAGVLSSQLLMAQMHRFQFKANEPFNGKALDTFPRYIGEDKSLSETAELLKQHSYLVLRRENGFNLVLSEHVIEAMLG